MGLVGAYGIKSVTSHNRSQGSDINYHYGYPDRRFFLSARFLLLADLPIYVGANAGMSGGARLSIRETALRAPPGLENAGGAPFYETTEIRTRPTPFAGFSLGARKTLGERLALSGEFGYANDTLERGRIESVRTQETTGLRHSSLSDDLTYLYVSQTRQRYFFERRSTGALQAMIWLEVAL